MEKLEKVCKKSICSKQKYMDSDQTDRHAYICIMKGESMLSLSGCYIHPSRNLIQIVRKGV